MTTTVHSFRKKPTPTGGIWIGRANSFSSGTFGNPHPLGKHGPCPECRRKYRLEVHHEPETVPPLFRGYFFQRVIDDAQFRLGVVKLRDKPLLCCGAKECHGHTIAAFVDSLPIVATEDEVIGAARAALAADEALDEPAEEVR